MADRTCRQLVPVVEKVAGDYSDKIKCCKVIVDLSPKLAGPFDITGIPTWLCLREDKETGRVLGSQTAVALKAKLASLLAAH